MMGDGYALQLREWIASTVCTVTQTLKWPPMPHVEIRGLAETRQRLRMKARAAAHAYKSALQRRHREECTPARCICRDNQHLRHCSTKPLSPALAACKTEREDLEVGGLYMWLQTASDRLILTFKAESTLSTNICHGQKRLDDLGYIQPVVPDQARLAAMLKFVGQALQQELKESTAFRPSADRLRVWLRAALAESLLHRTPEIPQPSPPPQFNPSMHEGGGSGFEMELDGAGVVAAAAHDINPVEPDSDEPLAAKPTGAEPRVTRSRALAEDIQFLHENEVRAMRMQVAEEETRLHARHAEAARMQEDRNRKRVRTFDPNKLYNNENVFKCPHCFYPNYYERDACNKLRCDNCNKAFCVVCLKLASLACKHLYGAHG